METVQPPTKRRRTTAKGTAAKPATTRASKATATKGGAKKGRAGATKATKEEEQVHEVLRSLGVQDPGKVSKCLKAGIINGFVKLLPPKDDPKGEFGLDQTLVEGECFMCDEELTCRVRDVLYQPEYGGHDYEDGGEDATFRCEATDECTGIYVTSICSGDPTFDSGKFHNHCPKHPDFGICIGDYREAHCNKCGDHYFAGGCGGSCYNCGKGGKGGRRRGRGGL